MKLEKRHELKLPSHCLDLTVSAEGDMYAACLDGGIYQLRPAHC